MKNFFNIGYEIKGLMAIYFVSIIFTYGVVSLISGNNIMPLELLWEFLLLAIIIGTIQILLYNEKVLTNISVKVKIAAHFIIQLIILIFFIKYFNWVEFWGIPFSIFIIIYTVYFIGITLNFYYYKKITGERFNDKLLRYKEKI
ncbi:DUF3021 family protein [Clostridium isatidis]|uniref:DUF3021 domain-containing protein n=1 Tax=Clostridium isatidis TaxID=182773 RepID=A0A343JD35_9CLOT|nr:DUF3021 family protein [Clostridium isatidis]ASW43443.1 DUF3021 domain-containing protein [Clostridium isatidis]